MAARAAACRCLWCAEEFSDTNFERGGHSGESADRRVHLTRFNSLELALFDT
jgi:hypothetical protein